MLDEPSGLSDQSPGQASSKAALSTSGARGGRKAGMEAGGTAARSRQRDRVTARPQTRAAHSGLLPSPSPAQLSPLPSPISLPHQHLKTCSWKGGDDTHPMGKGNQDRGQINDTGCSPQHPPTTKLGVRKSLKRSEVSAVSPSSSRVQDSLASPPGTPGRQLALPQFPQGPPQCTDPTKCHMCAAR